MRLGGRYKTDKQGKTVRTEAPTQQKDAIAVAPKKATKKKPSKQE